MKRLVFCFCFCFASLTLCFAKPRLVMTEVRNHSDQTITAIFARKGVDKVILLYPGKKFNVPALTTVTVSDGTKLYTIVPKQWMKQHEAMEVVGDGEYGCFVFQYGKGTPYIWTTDQEPNGVWD